MAPASRAEQFLLVSGVPTSGVIVRATAPCQIGSPLAETKHFNSSAIGVCLDGIGGDDTIMGSEFADALTGGFGRGDGHVRGPGGANSVDAGPCDDTMVVGGTAGSYFCGANGKDEIAGGNMADGVEAVAVADSVEGHGGRIPIS